MIQLREYTPEDYPQLAQWWEGHGWSPVPELILPKLGIIADMHAEESITPTAAAWLYMDNSSSVAMLKWMVSNPEANPRHVLRALKEILGFLKERAKELGYNVILATCRQDSLSKVLTKSGFEVTARDVIHHLALI